MEAGRHSGAHYEDHGGNMGNMGAVTAVPVPVFDDAYDDEALIVINRSAAGNGCADRPGDQQSSWIYQPPRLVVTQNDRSMTLTEVFFDFIFVLPLQSLFLVQVRTGLEAALFIVCYWATFTAWIGEAFFNTRFDTDDVIQRLLAVVQMLGVATMASGLGTAFGHGDATFAIGYVMVRGTLVLKYWRAWFALPKMRGILKGFIAGFTASVGFWLLSLAVDSTHMTQHYQLLLCGLGLALDTATPFALLALRKTIQVHANHMPERLTCWIVLMLAGNLFAVMMDMPPLGAASGWKATPFVFTLLAAMAPLSSLYLYGETMASSASMNAVWSESKLRLYTYIYLHLPAAAGYMLAAIGLSHTHCGHPSYEQCMGPNSAALIGAGLGLANLTLGLISCSVTSPVQLRVPALRCAAALVLAVVPPLFSDRLKCAGVYAVVVAVNVVQLACSCRAKPMQPTNAITAARCVW